MKPTKLEPTEKQIQDFTIELLNKAGWFVWRNNTGSFAIGEAGHKRWFRSGIKGSADIIGVTPTGHMAAVEVKRNKNKKPSIDQALFLDEIRKRGGVAVVVDSIDSALELVRNTT